MMQQPTGEDALRMWLVEANAKSMTKIYNETDDIILQDAYEWMMSAVHFCLKSRLKDGCYTDRFFDGTGKKNRLVTLIFRWIFKV